EEGLLGDLFGVGTAAEQTAAVLDQGRVARLVELGEGVVARSLVGALPAIELYGHGANFRRACGHAGSSQENTTTERDFPVRITDLPRFRSPLPPVTPYIRQAIVINP